jgi:hypothetical protein
VIDVIDLTLDKMDDSRYTNLLGKPTSIDNENQPVVQMEVRYKNHSANLVLDQIDVVGKG